MFGSLLDGRYLAPCSGSILKVPASTLANNAGGGICAGLVNVKNSLLATSTGQPNCFCGAVMTSLGVDFSTDGSCAGPSVVTPAQLNLGPLANNGGPTQTHALLLGSMAIDASPDCTDLTFIPVTTDQRGVARPKRPACDTGSFELALSPTSKDQCKDGGWIIFNDPRHQARRAAGRDQPFFSSRGDGRCRTSMVALATNEFSPAFQGRVNESLMRFSSQGEEALSIGKQHNGSISLMLTDMVMPGMSGQEIARHFASSHPKMKVLYMSGYTDKAIVHGGVLDPGIAFIQKPFAPHTLLDRVRSLLDAPVNR